MAAAPVPNSESECTFALADEDHTLGNAIRYALNRHADVVFAGYSVPHPSEPVLNVRVQGAEGRVDGCAAAVGARRSRAAHSPRRPDRAVRAHLRLL
jgi:DNA-directed RNA polymerase subunit L